MTIISRNYKFEDIYVVRVTKTGRKLYRTDPNNFVVPKIQQIDLIEVHKTMEVDEISMNMPEPEYEKFMQDYHHYMDILFASEQHPIIKDQLEKLIMMVQLLK